MSHSRLWIPSVLLVSLPTLLALSGCVVNSSSTPTSTCSLDATVSCAAGALGYSCNAADVTPDQNDPSLSCGAPTSGADGNLDYCCSTATSDTCSLDSAVTCSSGTGYSCTGTATPAGSDPTLSCGAGISEANGSVGYCCSASTTSTCSADSSVQCNTGASGYSCTGSDTPDQNDTSLVCSTGTADGSVTDYCCSTSNASTCGADSSVQCSGGASGYSCSGSDTPDQSDSSLVCSVGAPNGTATDYCCIQYSSSDCLEDPSVQGCQAGSYGFSCTDGTTPDQADSSLTCSTGTPGPNSGEMLYCCTK